MMAALFGLGVDEANAIGTLVAALAALLVVAGAIRAWYRRTLGRRRDRMTFVNEAIPSY
jgi:hypothetical protein